ncbi:MAG: AmmeMemoRadiSam system protein B [Hyphomicrobium sp.]
MPLNTATDASGPTRQPAVAGSFYPRTAETLSRTVSTFLAAAQVEARPASLGVIAPHAGYMYSGAVAAKAFACVEASPDRFRRAIVVGPAHFVPFKGIAAPSHTAFVTPLGDMPVDTDTFRSLADEALIVIDDEPHAPEHALEVELPFVQTLFGALPIVPLLFGFTSAEAIAAVITRLWTNDTLLIVSSDLSHYDDYETASLHDAQTAKAIETFDEAAIGPADACGHLAVRAALIAAKRRGLNIERFDLRNSGDAAGDKRSVVGYGAWAFLSQA